MNRLGSYTAANQYPVKLLQNPLALTTIKAGQIPPLHPQFIPTNRCNLKCGFCSCANRDKTLEMSTASAHIMLDDLHALGAKAITITGGGEPLLWPGLESFILAASQKGIQLGLVTNGVALAKLPANAVSRLTWCRISCSDEADRTGLWRETIAKNPGVDWALSYVLTSKPDVANLADHIDFANAMNMTHVRVVSDLLDLDNIEDMTNLKNSVRTLVDDSLAIYQGRKSFVRGCEDCRIGLLKPVIGPDGYIYPCCGVQYAHAENDLDLPESMRMGHISRLAEIWAAQKPFDGRQCARCYYPEYNGLLRAIQADLSHRAFV